MPHDARSDTGWRSVEMTLASIARRPNNADHAPDDDTAVLCCGSVDPSSFDLRNGACRRFPVPPPHSSSYPPP